MMDDLRAVLRHRDFRLLWLAASASRLGDQVVFIALALYVTSVGSPTDVGLVLAANAIPVVLFVLIGGVWADRLERHRVMVSTDVVRALLHGLLAALIFLGDVPIWAIVAIEAAFGTAEAFFNPAATGLIPQTVPDGQLQQANAAMSIVQNASELVGPAVATALVLGLGAGWAFAVDALTFVVSALLLVRLRPRSRGERAPRQRLRAELAIGWREVRSRQWAWVVIAATSLALLLALGPFLTLGPTVAKQQFGGAGTYGALMVALGAGTLIGSLTGLRWRPRHPIRFAMAWGSIWPPAIAIFALGPPLAVVGPLFVLVGFGFSMFDVSWDTALQERIPPHALSRVSSFDWMGSLALLPLGFLLAGPAAEAFGAVEVLVVGGLAAFLVHLVALATPGVWRLQNSPRPSSGVEASA
jgi:MFS family permease